MIIACKNFEQELNRAIRETGCDWPVQWVDAGLHSVPQKLKDELQGRLNELTDVENVVLGFGFCGNALLGLEPKNGAGLVFARADDCITLALGSQKRRQEFGARSYFLTNGWVKSDMNMWRDYEGAVENYGQEMADDIYEELMKGYEQLIVVDTQVCDREELRRETAEMAKLFDLELCMVDGDDSLTHKLVGGKWDDPDIIVIPAGRAVAHGDLFPEV